MIRDIIRSPLSDVELNPLGESLSRQIPTLTGTPYGTLDTAITFTADFEVECIVATTNTSTDAVFGYGVSGTINYLQFSASDLTFVTPDGSVTWTHGGAHSDGKVHVATAYRVGNTIGVKLDGVIKNTATLGAASTVNIDLVGCLGIATTPSQFFIGELLSTKFTDKSGAEDVVTNYVFDSGSTVEQYARGSDTLKVTFTNFTSANWNRYTLQRNILHDGGVIAEGWLKDTSVTNGNFNTDTGWTKGTGWSIAAGVASCDGTQVGVTDLEQASNHVSGDILLVESTLSNYSAGTLTQDLGGASGSAKSANGTTKEIITTTSTANIAMQGDAAFVGDIDNVIARKLLELA